jgi:RIO-like serine/threonine protein kinase
MHERHVYHGDLKPVNVLVWREEGRVRFSLVDLDAARIRRRSSSSLAVRDLGQLDSYLRREATAGERRRFLRLYAKGWPRDRRRRLLHAVRKESSRREARRCGG